MKRPAVYTAILALGVSVELLLLQFGRGLRAGAAATTSRPAAAAAAGPASGLFITLLQIVVIVVVARALARLLAHFRQPPVIGELAAGILLGPTLFGQLAPGAFAFLFPPQSIGALQTLSNVGLILFMFLIGLEFAPELMRERRESIVMVSHASIIVPFVLGTALALYLYPRLAEGGVSFRAFALFTGISMSVTAFPVLARILAERNLLRTRLGNTVIACAAVDDVTAWCVLALVVVIVRAGSAGTVAVKIVFVALYGAVMILAVRPLLRKLLPRAEGRAMHDAVLAGVLLLVLASSATTELLGIHALFGAFMAGAILPRDGRLREALVSQSAGLTRVVFLPLFFAVTGLRTNIALLFDSGALWFYCALILGVAVAGKVGGAMLSAVSVGIRWREAAAIGVLMNTRGLMELVVLNIGVDIGVISPKLFTMMVVMALVTTAMTSPLLDRLAASLDQTAMGALMAG